MTLSAPPIVSDRFDLNRPAVTGHHGMVSSQHFMASEAGVQILEAGGNAVDAAVATALALGVVEPWMSGIGGGGFMLVGDAATGEVNMVDFGMIAPLGLDVARYALEEGSSGNDALFSWPKVVEDRNQVGGESIAVPGAVAGLSAALERFGSGKVSWADVLAPAIALAKQGLPVQWPATLEIAYSADTLRHFETSSAIYLPDGLPAVSHDAHAPHWRPMGALPETLQRLADAGPRDFYEGEIAAKLVRDLQAEGSAISLADLAAYRADIRPALAVPYRGATVHLTRGFSGGPTFARALERIRDTLNPSDGVTAPTYLAWAEALTEAFDYRLSHMGHAGDMISQDASTTHLSVVDKDGNMVALTNTLLERFGSRVTLPETGVLMNNGMFWFDTRPGMPNSMAPGARPLSNMCPVLATKDGKPLFALGASGGRRIVPAGFQLTSLLIDFGLSLEDAYRVPRLDASGGEGILADYRLHSSILEALSSRYAVTQSYDAAGMKEFAKPQSVMQQGVMQFGMVASGLPPAVSMAARSGA
ncbi:MAG: gamma-glutamyltransferase family protein [Alphaproteobacteria bacterium]|jgi:gamma-glutamyltranspeptidase/glutathione hydrolase